MKIEGVSILKPCIIKFGFTKKIKVQYSFIHFFIQIFIKINFILVCLHTNIFHVYLSENYA